MNTITLNPNDKHNNISLSEDNLTATFSGSQWSLVKANLPRNSGKWYWEVEIVSSTHMVIGIGNDSTPLQPGSYSTGTGIRAYRGFGHTFGLIKDSSRGIDYANKIQFSNGDIIGIAIDIDKGTMEFYRNGIYMGNAFSDIDILGAVYPIISEHGNGKCIVNFGKYPFSIATNNFSEFARLSNEGYYSYCGYRLIDISSLLFSKMNITNDIGMITVNGILPEIYSFATKYKVKLDNNTIRDYSILPENRSVSFKINIDDLEFQSNIVRIVLSDETEERSVTEEYDIIKENRDTFIYKRRFDIDESYREVYSNLSYIPYEGLGLIREGKESITLNIPTEGKSNIESITIDSTDDVSTVIQKDYNLSLLEYDSITNEALFVENINLKDVDDIKRIMNKRRF